MTSPVAPFLPESQAQMLTQLSRLETPGFFTLQSLAIGTPYLIGLANQMRGSSRR
jgi:hypothetical protein